MTGNVASPDDIATLRAMDDAYLDALAKERAEAEQRMKGK